jgi:hypothetical protein
MKYRKNFGELPRYHKALGEVDSTFKDAGDNLINAVRVDYDPKTGKITPKIDTKELEKQIIKSVVDKVKQEVKNRIQSELIKQMSTQVAAMYAKYVVPGLQVVGAIEFAIKGKKTIKQVFDMVVLLYGKKIIDHFMRVFFGGIGTYRDRNVTFEDASRRLFAPHRPRDKDAIPGYKEEYKKFESMKFKATPSLIMLQYYPYYSGEKLEMNIINELYPDLKSLDKTARFSAACELSLFLRNSVEEPITTYLYSEEKTLEDGKIEISVSSEFQKELDQVIPLYIGEDSDFYYDIRFYTDSDKNIQPEFKDKKYIINPNTSLLDKHKVSLDFISLVNTPDEIKPFALSMKTENLDDYKIVKKENGQFVELPLNQYTKIDSHPNVYGKPITLDFDKIPKDVYIIRNKRVGSKAGKRDTDLWVKYIRDEWILKDAKEREAKIIQEASSNLLKKAVDLTATDPIEEYNSFVTQESTPKNELPEVRKGSPAIIAISNSAEKFSTSIKQKSDGGRIANMLKTMDSTTAKVFMKALEVHPYPFKGLSYEFYFNRVNKIVDAELSVIRKKNQRIGLGVAGLAVLGYLATQD